MTRQKPQKPNGSQLGWPAGACCCTVTGTVTCCGQSYHIGLGEFVDVKNLIIRNERNEIGMLYGDEQEIDFVVSGERECGESYLCGNHLLGIHVNSGLDYASILNVYSDEEHANRAVANWGSSIYATPVESQHFLLSESEYLGIVFNGNERVDEDYTDSLRGIMSPGTYTEYVVQKMSECAFRVWRKGEIIFDKWGFEVSANPGTIGFENIGLVYLNYGTNITAEAFLFKENKEFWRGTITGTATTLNDHVYFHPTSNTIFVFNAEGEIREQSCTFTVTDNKSYFIYKPTDGSYVCYFQGELTEEGESEFTKATFLGDLVALQSETTVRFLHEGKFVADAACVQLNVTFPQGYVARASLANTSHVVYCHMSGFVCFDASATQGAYTFAGMYAMARPASGKSNDRDVFFKNQRLERYRYQGTATISGSFNYLLITASFYDWDEENEEFLTTQTLKQILFFKGESVEERIVTSHETQYLYVLKGGTENETAAVHIWGVYRNGEKIKSLSNYVTGILEDDYFVRRIGNEGFILDVDGNEIYSGPHTEATVYQFALSTWLLIMVSQADGRILFRNGVQKDITLSSSASVSYDNDACILVFRTSNPVNVWKCFDSGEILHLTGSSVIATASSMWSVSAETVSSNNINATVYYGMAAKKTISGIYSNPAMSTTFNAGVLTYTQSNSKECSLILLADGDTEEIDSVPIDIRSGSTVNYARALLSTATRYGTSFFYMQGRNAQCPVAWRIVDGVPVEQHPFATNVVQKGFYTCLVFWTGYDNDNPDLALAHVWFKDTDVGQFPVYMARNGYINIETDNSGRLLFLDCDDDNGSFEKNTLLQDGNIIATGVQKYNPRMYPGTIYSGSNFYIYVDDDNYYYVFYDGDSVWSGKAEGGISDGFPLNNGIPDTITIFANKNSSGYGTDPIARFYKTESVSSGRNYIYERDNILAGLRSLNYYRPENSNDIYYTDGTHTTTLNDGETVVSIDSTVDLIATQEDLEATVYHKSKKIAERICYASGIADYHGDPESFSWYRQYTETPSENDTPYKFIAKYQDSVLHETEEYTSGGPSWASYERISVNGTHGCFEISSEQSSGFYFWKTTKLDAPNAGDLFRRLYDQSAGETASPYYVIFGTQYWFETTPLFPLTDEESAIEGVDEIVIDEYMILYYRTGTGVDDDPYKNIMRIHHRDEIVLQNAETISFPMVCGSADVRRAFAVTTDDFIFVLDNDFGLMKFNFTFQRVE